MKSLTDMLEQHYVCVDENTIYPVIGSRYYKAVLKCYGIKGQFVSVACKPDIYATVEYEHIVGSPDDNFTDKYILSVNDRFVGVCNTEQCVLSEVRKQLCL